MLILLAFVGEITFLGYRDLDNVVFSCQASTTALSNLSWQGLHHRAQVSVLLVTMEPQGNTWRAGGKSSTCTDDENEMVCSLVVMLP